MQSISIALGTKVASVFLVHSQELPLPGLHLVAKVTPFTPKFPTDSLGYCGREPRPGTPPHNSVSPSCGI